MRHPQEREGYQRADFVSPPLIDLQVFVHGWLSFAFMLNMWV
jgi:hypothetical protein